MKNFTKILFLGVFLFSQSARSQNLHIDDGVYNVVGSVNDNNLSSHLVVENTSSNDISVLINLDKSQMVFGQQTYYCWFQCYDTTVALSPDPLVLPGRTIDSLSFHSYLYPLGHTGTSVLTYTFYDMNNPTDQVVQTITYDVLNTGIDEISSNGSLSSASPNPASAMTGISYNLPSMKDAHIIIYNMLGTVVKDLKLSSKQSMLLVSTAELQSGIYIYSLVNNGKQLATKKLVVAHR